MALSSTRKSTTRPLRIRPVQTAPPPAIRAVAGAAVACCMRVLLCVRPSSLCGIEQDVEAAEDHALAVEGHLGHGGEAGIRHYVLYALVPHLLGRPNDPGEHHVLAGLRLHGHPE